MATEEVLERGREAFRRQAWGEAYTQLTAAEREAPLEVEDLERLAVAAQLAGRDDESVETWTHAYHESLRLGDAARAARAAFWLTFTLMNRGDFAQGSGWLARGRRLLDEGGLDCVEKGYLLVPMALQSLGGGDAASAYATFEEVGAIADRFGDRDLQTMSRLGRGQALIAQGKIGDGVGFLDEAMVAVTAGELSETVVGIVYCASIESCQQIFDLARAKEWTSALNRWCESHPELVRYRGECLTHRAEIMQLQGAWEEAVAEARNASERLSGHPAAGSAYYVEAELHRVRGEFAKAEEAYRQANQAGRSPQPGLAELRLAQGRVDAAVAAIRRAQDETQDPIARSRLLPAQVEVALVADDVAGAREAANELSEIASELGAPFLRAASAHATGAVQLREGEAQAALGSLRQALTGWQELEAPYEAARTRSLIAQAYRSLGDEDGAEMELDAARRVFQGLGATPDLRRLEAEAGKEVKAAGGLTRREVEVLRLIAAGKTNRAIASDLVVSEKTVARHVSNILTKLKLSTRAAATAYAYENDLV